MPKALTVEIINNRINSEGYVCTAYDKKTKKFKYICPKNHKGSMRMDHWSRGVRCSKCAGNRKLSLNYIKSKFEKENYQVLSTSYNNSHTPLEIICNKGHRGNITWDNWNLGHRCLECSGKKKKTYNDVTKNLRKEGYTLKTSVYISNKKLLECVCTNGHIYKVSYDNWKNKGVRCPKCSEYGKSLAEKRLVAFIRKHYTQQILTNNRTILNNRELDIVLPDINIAIEYCGLYWHSEQMGKNKNYHLDKLEECLSKGYQLITIFEDEFITKPDVVKSRLLSYINSSNFKTIYARKCTIKEINPKQARVFCESNHLQGYGAGASIKLGAFYNNELLAVMTFSRPSIAKGYRPDKNKYELHRFCSKLNFKIIGIASKLLKYFKVNYAFSTLYTYADRRWSIGNLYDKLGFTFSYNTKPNYWYFKNNKKRIYRYTLRKSTCSNIKLTEKENRILEGYNIIWDCGNKKYELFN
jgi:hypothetical protein